VEKEFEEVRIYINSKLIIKADKDWVRKIFNKIRDIMKKREDKEKEREEAILSRKPIENIMCGSCDTKMAEMRGLKADH